MRLFLAFLLKVFLYGSCFLGAVSAIYFAGFMQFCGNSFSIREIFFVFLLIPAVYNLPLLKIKSYGKSEKWNFLFENRCSIFLLQILSVIFCLSARPEYLSIQHAYGVILTFFYMFGLRGYALRNIFPAIKPFIVGLTWALFMSYMTEKRLSKYFFLHFCFFSALTIPFEIRDEQTDKESGLKTLRYYFSDKLLLGASSFLLFSNLFLTGIFTCESTKIFSVIPVCLFSLILFFRGETPKRAYYFDLIFDGMIALQGIVWLFV